MLLVVPLPWAVHLPDSVLAPPWQLGGFVLLGLLMLAGAWRLREEDLPGTALLAAAFFVATLIHVPVGPSKAHLLLNGLIGVILGRRAALAIPAGLFLQAVLLGHGGLLTLGVNSCVMALPALAAGGLFHQLHRHRLASPLVAASVLFGVTGVVGAAALLITSPPGSSAKLDPGPALEFLGHPVTIGVAVLLTGVTVWLARRRGVAPEFALGLFLGEFAVLLTLALQAVVLVFGAEKSWDRLAVALFLVHLPVAAVEGVVLGFTLSFLVRVKPQLLGLDSGEAPCAP